MGHVENVEISVKNILRHECPFYTVNLGQVYQAYLPDRSKNTTTSKNTRGSPGYSKYKNIAKVGRSVQFCPYCDYSTVHSTVLKRHIIKHTGERPFACEICGIISSFMWQSKSISKQTASKNQTSFDTNVIKQTGLNLFSCNHCSYATHHKGHFNIHMRVHTGERPFKCNMCGKAFAQKIGLRRHLLSHQNTYV
ncbi:hypothetical protein TNCT_548422 [Trichonephila clavata]|uniref:C2H2-type domain-containing protein n=1 Tax=Trichonephila clavata TaxID=2740835 RepID=A0A8X6M005_TRICU|nr:hypothetical protein TNCT_548422 [Trichonephila clavata]